MEHSFFEYFQSLTIPTSLPTFLFLQLMKIHMRLWRQVNIRILNQLEEEFHLLFKTFHRDPFIQPMEPDFRKHTQEDVCITICGSHLC